MTEETFDAIKKEYTYVDVDGFDKVDKLELKENDNVTAIFNTVSEENAITA